MIAAAKFENGDIVKDTVTGYEGVVMATTVWLNGCYRYTLQAKKLNKDGIPHDGQTFDENQLRLVKAMHFNGNHDTGGPRPNVSQGKDIRR